MSWRTVIITNRCKLDLKMGYMVVRAEETKRILIDEIAILLIENPAVSLTGCLLEALIEKKVRIIFCDSRRSPMAELVPHNGSYDASRKIKMQTAWTDDIKGWVWSEIVSEKIRKQAEFLRQNALNVEADLLESYVLQIEFNDSTNREGHAAKVYFNALFGKQFTRSEDCPTNAALNYGYQILLSAFSREVSANGYLCQLGIFHDNVFNHFNLSCDLMEPFRILVDREVYNSVPFEFDKEMKYRLWNMLNGTVVINSARQTVLNAIRIYTRSVLRAVNDMDVSAIEFYSRV